MIEPFWMAGSAALANKFQQKSIKSPKAPLGGPNTRSWQVVEPAVKAFLYTWGRGRTTAEGEHIPARIEQMEIHHIDGMLVREPPPHPLYIQENSTQHI